MAWKIHPSQLGRVNKLVRRLCSCYDRGNCILLDDGEPHKCVQLISYSGIYCNYFKNAVLPADKELYKQKACEHYRRYLISNRDRER